MQCLTMLRASWSASQEKRMMRAEPGAIQVIAKQLGAQISQDGSVYDVSTKTLYFPTEDAFYYIRMPGDCACTEDDIRELFVMKIQDLS